MSRVRPVLVAVLLVVASATAALAVGGSVSAPVDPGDDPVVGVSESSTRVLLLTEADAAAFNGPNTSVTNALDAGHASLSNDLELHAVEQRLERVETREAQRALLENASDSAAERVDELLARERTARAEYAAGDITATEYLVTLGTLHAEASSLAGALGQTVSSGTLYGFASDFSDIRSEISRSRARLAMIEGPVRQQIAGVVTGQRDSVRVHVTVGNGVMLSTIEDGGYVREAVRPGNVDSELGGTFSEAPSIIQNHYPWLTNHSTSRIIETRGQFAFYHTTSYDHGQITTYIDTTTERVYVERHEQTLSQLPADTEVTKAANNTTLSTSRTYAGGPMLVRVENATGSPIDTPVALDGQPIGETGDDGRLWVLSPAGDYSITVTTNDGAALEANVTARPSP